MAENCSTLRFTAVENFNGCFCGCFLSQWSEVAADAAQGEGLHKLLCQRKLLIALNSHNCSLTDFYFTTFVLVVHCPVPAVSWLEAAHVLEMSPVQKVTKSSHQSSSSFMFRKPECQQKTCTGGTWKLHTEKLQMKIRPRTFSLQNNGSQWSCSAMTSITST